MVDGHFGEKFDRGTNGWEICFCGLCGLLVRGCYKGERKWKRTYLVGLVESCHESCSIGLDLSTHILAILVLLCIHSMQFKEQTNNSRTRPRIIRR